MRNLCILCRIENGIINALITNTCITLIPTMRFHVYAISKNLDFFLYFMIHNVLQMEELDSLLHEVKAMLYGSNECEPAVDACAQLTQEFFRENTFRLIIICLPKLNLEVSIYTFDSCGITLRFLLHCL